MAIGAYLDIITETFTRKAIPQLIELNKKSFAGISGYPQLIHGDIESQSLAELGTYLKDMCGLGIIAPDTPQIDKPSVLYGFTWLLDDGNYIGVSQYEINDASHTDLLEGLIAYDMKITGQDLAVYLKNCTD